MNKSFVRIFNLINNYADVYNYTFSFDNEFQKTYFMDKDNLYFSNNDDSIQSYIELISLGFNILGSIGFDPIVKINSLQFEKDKYYELIENLDYLEIDYEEDNFQNTYDKLIFNIYDNDILFLKGGFKDNKVFINFELNNILDKNTSNDMIDICFKANTKEEILKANIVMQDLRLNGIICDLNTAINSKFIIDINNEDLKKGMVNIKDNATGEDIKIPEDEIIDYILGVI